MAGAGYRTFAVNEVLTSSNVQSYLQDQTVMVFASSSARTSALASPSQGMTTFLTDSNTYWQWFDAYNSSTNPGGAATAGWYPLPGSVSFHGVRDNTSLSIPNATFTIVSCNSFSNAGMTLDSTSTPATVTVPVAGMYRVTGYADRLGWSSTSGTYRYLGITKNGTALNNSVLSVSSTIELSKVSGVVKLAANDVIRLGLQQDSGGAATNSKTGFSVEFVRPVSV